MKIGFVHFTDCHIDKDLKWFDDKIQNVSAALKNYFEECEKVYLIITGDVAYSGTQEEYEKAYIIFNKIRSNLKIFYPNKIFDKYIIVPGNHDCNFSLDNSARRSLITNISEESFNDNSVIDTCLGVQKPFFKFMNHLNECSEKLSIFWSYNDNVNGRVVAFNCFNTAWMSSINEAYNSIIIPFFKVENNIQKGEINIAAYHHSLQWLQSKTGYDNRKQFEKFIEDNANIVFYGHDHKCQGVQRNNLYDNISNLFFSGESFFCRESKKVVSGFQSIVIDINNKSGSSQSFRWNNDHYEMSSESRQFGVSLLNKSKGKFQILNDFFEELNIFDLPLTFETKATIKLADIFVYPDVEQDANYSNNVDDTIDSESLLKGKYKTILLEGDGQSGKTSLLKMMYLTCLDGGKYPLMIDGRIIKHLKIDNLDTILSKVYSKQYNDSIMPYEVYSQYDNDLKLLFIDNINDIELNLSEISSLLTKVRNRFGIVCCTSISLSNIISIVDNSRDTLCAKILPLGHLKRNSIIEKYYKIVKPADSTSNQDSLKATEELYTKVQDVLGDEFMPSYPVFILSILQSIHYSRPTSNIDQTSYGYCYQTLIHYALAIKAKIANADIDTYFNFLSGIAYELYSQKLYSFQEDLLIKYYQKHSKDFLVPAYNILIKKILLSNLLVIEDDYYRFCYNYIYYFLVAKHISELMPSEQGKKEIKHLCDNLQDEKNANILIFIAHHSKDNYLIDETIFSLMLPFEGIEPVTLDKGGNFSNIISEFIREIKKGISSDTIRTDVNPAEERRNQLRIRDNIDRRRKHNMPNTDDDDISTDVISFNKAIRSLEIAGHIIKNRKGSLKKDKLEELVKEEYLAGFRIINYFGLLIQGTKEEVSKLFKSKVDKGESLESAEKSINVMLQYLAFSFCINIFSCIIHFVGNKDLEKIFENISSKIGSPASKLVTFSIKSCYGNMSSGTIQELAKEYKDNPVALQILKARVRAYLYNNYVDYKKQQKIASALGMKVENAHSIQKLRQ